MEVIKIRKLILYYPPPKLVVKLGGLLLYPVEQQPGDLDKGDDEGAEGSSSEVEDGGLPHGSKNRRGGAALVRAPEPAGEQGGKN